MSLPKPSAAAVAALLLAAVLAHACAQSSDPNCRTGIAGNGACCVRKCRQCGGANCVERSRDTGERCCASAVRNTAKSCNASKPPCVLPANSPTMLAAMGAAAVSTTNGRWQTAKVRSGSLVRRHEACAVMVNGLVVLVGGRGVNKPVSIYNPKTGAWTQRNGPGPGIEIHHFQCVVIKGKIWIVASWTGGFPREKNNDKGYLYDVKANKWSTFPAMPSNRNRGGGVAVRKGSWIYVVAGNRGGHGPPSTSLTWMDAFNWKTKKWSTQKYPNMPGGGRDHVGGAMVKGRLCVAGGRDGGVQRFFRATLLSTYCFNFKSRKWQRSADFPQGRAGAMTGTTCDGRMMIAGGEGSGMAFKRVDVFDGNKWQQAPDMKEGRHGSGLAVAKCSCGHIFIPSGSGSQGGSPELPSTEQYIPGGAKATCTKY